MGNYTTLPLRYPLSLHSEFLLEPQSHFMKMRPSITMHAASISLAFQNTEELRQQRQGQVERQYNYLVIARGLTAGIV